MNFFKRLAMVIYMLLMLAVGIMLILVSLNVVSPQRWADMISLVNENIGYQASLGTVGALLVIIGLLAPYRLEKSLKKNRIIAFQNPDGEVTVSLSAIEEYVLKVANGVAGIKDVRSNVSANKKGINIVTNVSVAAGANIPEITEVIQSEVKNKVHGMLGVEEKINMTMHIKKITGSALPVGPEPEEPEHVPFREMG